MVSLHTVYILYSSCNCLSTYYELLTRAAQSKILLICTDWSATRCIPPMQIPVRVPIVLCMFQWVIFLKCGGLSWICIIQLSSLWASLTISESTTLRLATLLWWIITNVPLTITLGILIDYRLGLVPRTSLCNMGSATRFKYEISVTLALPMADPMYMVENPIPITQWGIS